MKRPDWITLAIELWRERLAKGYIIVYRRTAQSASTARVRALRAKKYLIGVLYIKADRLIGLLIGEPIGEFTVELYIVPEGAEPPTPLRLRPSGTYMESQ